MAHAIKGRLGEDPDLRYTSGGTPVCNIRVAETLGRRKNRDGDYEDITEWHLATVWGSEGEKMAEEASKGSVVLIAGDWKTNRWEDRDGKTNYTKKLNVDCCKVYTKGNAAKSGGRRGRSNDPDPYEDDDGIPF